MAREPTPHSEGDGLNFNTQIWMNVTKESVALLLTLPRRDFAGVAPQARPRLRMGPCRCCRFPVEALETLRSAKTCFIRSASPSRAMPQEPSPQPCSEKTWQPLDTEAEPPYHGVRCHSPASTGGLRGELVAVLSSWSM